MSQVGARLTRATVFVASMAWSCLAFGQGQPDLYQRVLNDPSNVQLTIQYAEQAKQRGDYEAAISAYERLLLFNPALSQLKYELGQLYFELESYAVARTYFEASIAAPNTPVNLQDGAKAYIAEIDRRLSPNRYRVYLHSGLRYQSNANAGPGSDLVRLGGQPANLAGTSFASRPDWNAFGLGVLEYEHDFGNARGDSFEASLAGYYAKQFEVSRVDLGAAELQAGPRFALFPETILGATTKIYGIVNGFTLGDDPYLRTLGGGVSVRWKSSPTLVFDSAFEYRNRKYFDSTDYPNASQQTGDLYTFATSGTGRLYGPVRWLFRTGYDWNSSGFEFWSYKRPFVDVGLSNPVLMPWFNRSWLFTAYAGLSKTSYSQPDPSVDPAITREDREWHLGLNIDADLAWNVGMRLNLYYQNNDSNLETFAYKNFAVSFGPTIRF
jgi:tetratricopeptide (TPR) repeat protein